MEKIMEKHVLSTALEIRDKIYEKNGEIFTGFIFYDLGNNCLERKYVEKGILTNKIYTSLCIPGDSKHKHDIPLMKENAFEYAEGCLFTHEPHTLVKKKLVILSFGEDGYLEQEDYYENGFSEHSIGWNIDGSAWCANLNYGDIKLLINSDNIDFQYEIIELNKNIKNTSVSINYNYNNEIYSISIKDSIKQSDLDRVSQKAPFSPFKTVHEIITMKIAKKLTIRNYTQGTSFLIQLFNWKDINNIDKISILNHVGSKNIDAFLNFPNLCEVNFFWSTYLVTKEECEGMLKELRLYLLKYEDKYKKRIQSINVEYDYEKYIL